MSAVVQCFYEGCGRPTRAAIRTTRPSRADMRVTLYTDDRTAPGTATGYCREHVLAMLHDLAEVLVDGD